MNIDHQSITKHNTLSPNNTSWFLTLRIERPICGSEIGPNAFLSIKGNQIDNSAKAKLIESTPHVYKYKWYKSKSKRICSNQKCPRGNNYSPVDWTSFNLNYCPSLVCALCDKNNFTNTFYCSKM
jgi:hypothetical protein